MVDSGDKTMVATSVKGGRGCRLPLTECLSTY